MTAFWGRVYRRLVPNGDVGRGPLLIYSLGEQLMSRPRCAALCLCLAAFCVVCATPVLAAIPTEYQPNYDLGYSEGYPVGYDSGLIKGKERGQTEGTSAGQKAGYQSGWDDAYQPAYDLAYEAKFAIGEEQGYVDGFPDGFVEGYDWGPTLLSIMSGSVSLGAAYDNWSAGLFAWNRTTGGAVCIEGANTYTGLILTSGGVTFGRYYYDLGYDDGKTAGLSIGSQEGYDFTYPTAYAAAFDIAYPKGTKAGTLEGTRVGGQVGFDDGWDEGFDDGHGDGFHAGVQYYLYGAFDVPDRLLCATASVNMLVPEPSAVLLAGMGLLGLLGVVRRRR